MLNSIYRYVINLAYYAENNLCFGMCTLVPTIALQSTRLVWVSAATPIHVHVLLDAAGTPYLNAMRML